MRIKPSSELFRSLDAAYGESDDQPIRALAEGMYVALTRTPAMQEKLSRAGFGPHYLDVTNGPSGYKKKVRRRGGISP